MSNAVPSTRHTTTVSLALRREIDTLKGQFIPYVEASSTLTTRRKDLAPGFMRLYKRYKRETGGTFVAFVRELDPKMPAERNAYKDHPSYQSGLYLRRLIDAPLTTPQHRKTASPFRVLASVMDTLVYYVRKHSPKHEAEILVAFRRLSKWDNRQMEKLQAVMRRVSPLHIPGTPRLVKRIALPIDLEKAS